MKDGSMNSKKFNMGSLPSTDKRPLVGEYKKTIILLTGKANIGKSTLADLLINDKFNYISVDSVCLTSGIHEISNFLDYTRSTGYNINQDLGKLFDFIYKNCPDTFINFFFNVCIRDNENLNILVEGYLLSIDKLYSLFMDKCKEYNYRVWKIERTL